MDRYTIYQAIEGNFFAKELSYNDFWAVADVEISNSDSGWLEKVYTLSQNIDDSWLKNEGVTSQKSECRSTSVGDIIYSHGTDSYFMVDDIGFKQVKLQNQKFVKIKKQINHYETKQYFIKNY